MPQLPTAPAAEVTDWYGVAVRKPSPRRSLQRRSPPPPVLNLDDCKPVLTTTGTSTGSSASSSTAFVFTSSRTNPNRGHYESPQSPQPSSPASPSSDVSSVRSRPTLSPSQLARHSEGAIDAREILGPNMRAAGFVHLTNSLSSETHALLHNVAAPQSASPPSTPGSRDHLTPSDPPLFPPIMFMNPTVDRALPMWEYQKTLPWGPYPATGAHDHAHPRAMSADAAHGPGASQPSMSSRTLVSSFSAGSGSSSTLVSSPSTSGALSTIPASMSHRSIQQLVESERQRFKGKTSVRDMGPSEYPFPRTFAATSRMPPASSATPREVTFASQPVAIPIGLGQIDSEALTTAPRAYRSASSKERAQEGVGKSQRPAPKPVQAPDEREKLIAKEKKNRDKDKERRAREKQKDPRATRKFATASASEQAAHQFSITELCDASPFAWTSRADNFGPMSLTPQRAASSTSGGYSQSSRHLSSTPAAVHSTSGSSVTSKSSASHSSTSATTPSSGAASDPLVRDREREKKARERVEAIAEEPEERRSSCGTGSSGSDKGSEREARRRARKKERELAGSGSESRHRAKTDRGRGGSSKALGSEQRQREARELKEVAYAHRERDREAARGRDEWDRQQRRARAKEKNIAADAQSQVSDPVVVSVVQPPAG